MTQSTAMSRRMCQSLVGLSLLSAFRFFFFLPVKLLGYDWQQLVVVLVTILPEVCVGGGPTSVLRNWLFSSPNRVSHGRHGLARSGLFRIAHAFTKHLEEEHMTWAQFGKKRDKKTTLQDFDEALDLQCVETASKSPLTPSKLEGDDVIIICDDVTVADLKKPIKDSTG
ncbi:hypothetical protein Tco_1149698 [Tanacetum coccineum]